MISVLQAMPEAVHFDYSQKDGDYLLRGVGDKNSFFMPSWQQKTQGDATIFEWYAYYYTVPSSKIKLRNLRQVKLPAAKFRRVLGW